MLRVGSDKLCNDLIKHGCLPRKTFILKWPTTIPENLIRHFIRGLFDGDGCVLSKSKHNQMAPNFRFQITGTKDICQGTNEFFHKLFNFKLIKLYHHRNSYVYLLGGNYQVKQVFFYLYNNSNKNLKLRRKYNKFKKILKYDTKPIIKTSKYKYITYKKNDCETWQIIKWKGRSYKILGRYKTEKDAYIGLCHYEDSNKLPFSNNPREYFEYIKENYS